VRIRYAFNRRRRRRYNIIYYYYIMSLSCTIIIIIDCITSAPHTCNHIQYFIVATIRSDSQCRPFECINRTIRQGVRPDFQKSNQIKNIYRDFNSVMYSYIEMCACADAWAQYYVQKCAGRARAIVHIIIISIRHTHMLLLSCQSIPKLSWTAQNDMRPRKFRVV